jgi:hypothetical protein
VPGESEVRKISLVISSLIISNIAIANICEKWTTPVKTGQHTRALSEVSGLATSMLKKDHYIWANDSGSDPILHASMADGIITKSVDLRNFSNRDFEAVEQGVCPNSINESCIFVSDTGNNSGFRPKSKIAVFREVDFWNSSSIQPILIKEFRTRKNFEAMVINENGEAILFSKNKSGRSEMFKLNFLNNRSDLVQTGTLDMNYILEGHPSEDMRITDASYSKENGTILLLTYGDIIEVSAQNIFENTNILQWVEGKDYKRIKSPKNANLTQKETVAYSTDQDNFIISSESESSWLPPPAIYQYSCVK